ncbi:MAG: transporter substrate-binding domain-containing protein [Prosthecobacter sp.]|uniref:transporter substrate-binding domain-containing protein n=1 Tax=Prosthecobacter sp. TaxID=1965333 RepID=UPI0025F9412B|nr:transporter substrate-binding domain-containing protein [Prosthecobacter sp.]MCF7788281.1 transporter substrate-binding domain-containing protein [Prosthecobacter sp.]
MKHLISLLVLFTLCACSRSNKLIIGTDATYPPFEFVDEKGQITGVDIEVGREIGKALGREVEFRNINFDGLITALRTGSIDLVISALSVNPERSQSIDFSDPYVKTGLSILAAKDSTVQSAADLKTPGRKIVVRLGTTGESWARANLKDAKIIALDADVSCVMEVVNASVDAWIYDQVSVMNHHAKHPEKTRALLAPLREEVWAVGLKKGNEELKNKVNEVLARMRKDGSFTKLAERYMAKEQAMMTAQGLPLVFELK